MRFEPITARENWRAQAAKMGYLVQILDNPPYWMEALPDNPFCAVFSEKEIEGTIKVAVEELTEASLRAVEHICNGPRSEELFSKLCIAAPYRDLIRKSWNRKDPSLYGRCDFSYNNGELKLLEMNFDTAVNFYESAILQRFWLEDLRSSGKLPQNAGQFNSLHKDLVGTFAKLMDREKLFYFSCYSKAPEDEGNTRYMESCAVQAGQPTAFVYVQDLGYDSERRLIDRKKRLIKRLFKLYPWEDFLDDDSGFIERLGKSSLIPIVEQELTQFFEPVWKLLLSNKGILPILYELNPDSPYLLPSYFEDSEEGKKMAERVHVRKPIYGRDGLSVSIVYPDDAEATTINPGPYGDEGFILQEYHQLAEHNQHHIVIGAWVIDLKPAGMGLRADLNRITTGANSIFVPHYIVD